MPKLLERSISLAEYVKKFHALEIKIKEGTNENQVYPRGSDLV